MKPYKIHFLEEGIGGTPFNKAKIVIVPFSYEGGVSFGAGAARGPDAIISASDYLEVYDEILDAEPWRVGICTIEPPQIPDDPEEMLQILYETTRMLLKQDKFIIVIGGDHSITPGYFKALKEKYDTVSVIQIDAHADLRQTYEGSIFSHACTMSRIREMTLDTFQIGIHSLSFEEAQLIKDENIPVCMMHDYRKGNCDFDTILSQLPDPVFITFDVDVLDWNVVRSTGTPEPGGLSWTETISLLDKIFSRKKVVGFDFVEFAHDKNDNNSAFAAAKLIYKMIGFQFRSWNS